MAGIVSKNLYELLGNDPELDPERATPKPPVQVVDKPAARLGKRNGPAEAPGASAVGGSGGPATGPGANRGGRRDNTTGNERAYRDRGASSTENRRRAPDDGLREDRHPDRVRADRGEYRGRGRGRGASGGRGFARGAGRPDDRHSKTGIADHEKQAAHGWGGNTGNDEWNDEKAGEAIAKDEGKEGFDADVAAPVDADGNALNEDAAEKVEEPEEPKVKSLESYYADQAEKRANLNEGLALRQANEGAGKKHPEGKTVERTEEEDFIAGSGGKKSRERTKKEKTLLELDGNAMRPAESGSDRPTRGGRGGGRGRGGDRDRGDRPERSERPDRGDRGDRGERGDRGDRGDRGEYRGRGGRGGRGGGEGRPRGEFRGGRGGRGGASGPNVDDQSAFPSLGA